MSCDISVKGRVVRIISKGPPSVVRFKTENKEFTIKGVFAVIDTKFVYEPCGNFVDEVFCATKTVVPERGPVTHGVLREIAERRFHGSLEYQIGAGHSPQSIFDTFKESWFPEGNTFANFMPIPNKRTLSGTWFLLFMILCAFYTK